MPIAPHKLCSLSLKRGFKTEELARGEISRLVRMNRDTNRGERFSLSTYLCGTCKLWHFGHGPKALKIKFPAPLKGKSRHAFGRK